MCKLSRMCELSRDHIIRALLYKRLTIISMECDINTIFVYIVCQYNEEVMKCTLVYNRQEKLALFLCALSVKRENPKETTSSPYLK